MSASPLKGSVIFTSFLAFSTDIVVAVGYSEHQSLVVELVGNNSMRAGMLMRESSTGWFPWGELDHG